MWGGRVDRRRGLSLVCWNAAVYFSEHRRFRRYQNGADSSSLETPVGLARDSPSRYNPWWRRNLRSLACNATRVSGTRRSGVSGGRGGVVCVLMSCIMHQTCLLRANIASLQHPYAHLYASDSESLRRYSMHVRSCVAGCERRRTHDRSLGVNRQVGQPSTRVKWCRHERTAPTA